MSSDNGRVLEEMTIADSSGLGRDYWSAILGTSLRPASVPASSSAEKEVPWELSSSALVSIRAEEAWQITRGSPDVTIAIIDEGFDKSWLPQGAYFETMRVGVECEIPCSFHGTMLAGLIAGTRMGYPGVAPRCRLLGIEIPSSCSDHDEAKAFDVALEADAAIVCCGWGPRFCGPHIHRLIPRQVALSIDRVSRQSRNGLGAITFFAVGASGSDVALDGYVSHPAVAAVSGVDCNGRVPATMDFGEKIAICAPVSGGHKCVGGRFGAPSGASAATALASGVAGLMFSVNPKASAREGYALLRSTATALPHDNRPASTFENRFIYRSPSSCKVINAAEAVHASLNLRRSITAVTTLDHETSIRPRLTLQVSEKERRLGGGEHTLLAWVAILALRQQYLSFSKNTSVAFFEDIFTDFTLGKAPEWAINANIIDVVLDSFITKSSLTIPFRGPFYFKYLVGLAADIYDCPDGLLSALQDTTPDQTIDKLSADFEKEMNGPTEENVWHLYLNASILPAWWSGLGDDAAHFLALADKNASHFVGENLLSYLSYHLLAVNLACECSMPHSDAVLRHLFTMALLHEAFAVHYLTDMFSAGHARVPRRAIIDSLGRADYAGATPNADKYISRFLHQYDGELGVFFTNALGYVWYAYGDSQLLVRDTNTGGGSPVYVIANGDLQPFANKDEPLNTARLLDSQDWNSIQNTPLVAPSLATTLVFASLADVLRHTADGFEIRLSAQGRTNGSTGLLGYILDRLPFALPTKPFPSQVSESVLKRVFGPKRVDNASLPKRMEDINTVFERISSLDLMGILRYIPPPRGGRYHRVPPIEVFGDVLYKYYLTPTRLQDLATQQAAYLSGLLDPTKDSFLTKVPSLISQFFYVSTDPKYRLLYHSDLLYTCGVDKVNVPPTWQDALQGALTKAPSLISVPGGVWGVG